MVAERYWNRSRIHLAGESFVTFCGNENMLVRDSVEYQDGTIVQVGESSRILKKMDSHFICKKCMKKLIKPPL